MVEVNVSTTIEALKTRFRWQFQPYRCREKRMDGLYWMGHRTQCRLYISSYIHSLIGPGSTVYVGISSKFRHQTAFLRSAVPKDRMEIFILRYIMSNYTSNDYIKNYIKIHKILPFSHLDAYLYWNCETLQTSMTRW